MIDPIDGTYGYIQGKDEFTVNAALILNKKPIAGIINAPGKGRIFYSFGSSNSYEINNASKIKLACKKRSKQSEINAISYLYVYPKASFVLRKDSIIKYKTTNNAAAKIKIPF